MQPTRKLPQMPEPFRQVRLFADLSQSTLQARNCLAPVTMALRQQIIMYRWSFSTKIILTMNGVTHIISRWGNICSHGIGDSAPPPPSLFYKWSWSCKSIEWLFPGEGTYLKCKYTAPPLIAPGSWSYDPQYPFYFYFSSCDRLHLLVNSVLVPLRVYTMILTALLMLLLLFMLLLLNVFYCFCFSMMHRTLPNLSYCHNVPSTWYLYTCVVVSQNSRYLYKWWWLYYPQMPRT